ncbi:polysaccharide deacetylase family protein [Planomonospora alba]|uniref:Polysaccharide deacetylase family protein n=1 Tax=Planomonospora alba TaxID=161354 RepID=A0ABP6NJJ9_9ACTN
MPVPSRRRAALSSLPVLLSAVLLLVTGLGPQAAAAAPPAASAAARPSTAAAAGGFTGGQAGTGRSTLVLYDTTGPWGWLGELYGAQAANLTGHFGSYTALPVGEYTAGRMDGFTAVVYVGSTYDEPLPEAFLADVRSAERPVVWMNHNIWQLTASTPAFAADYGWMWRQFDFSAVGTVVYKDRKVTRDTRNASGVMDYSAVDRSKAEVLATAVRDDGTTFPWALRSRNLTYIGEIPFAYTTATDRYLAFSDLLFDVLAPGTEERHRALVRLEDIGPNADPAELLKIARELKKRRIPYSFGVYTVYKEPGTTVTLRQRPLVVAAIKYMLANGGTMIAHGYTHQYTDAPNPYNGTSGDDFEFYTAHVDEQNYVRYDGPVAEDSPAWAADRIGRMKTEFRRAGLPVPRYFEFPHYAGSAVDYEAVRRAGFAARYERSLYFAGTLSGTAVRYEHMAGQFFPYTVTDVYGSKVVPENIGNLIPKGYNNHPSVLPGDLAEAAEANLVVRDGVASFFYHPYLGTKWLLETVDGIKRLGYTFVPASAL